jgi:hypothetical protein
MNLRDEILAAEKNIGRHPLGTFEGRIEEIKHVELQHGYEKWEITVATDHGRVRSDAFVPNSRKCNTLKIQQKHVKGTSTAWLGCHVPLSIWAYRRLTARTMWQWKTQCGIASENG